MPYAFEVKADQLFVWMLKRLPAATRDCKQQKGSRHASSQNLFTSSYFLEPAGLWGSVGTPEVISYFNIKCLRPVIYIEDGERRDDTRGGKKKSPEPSASSACHCRGPLEAFPSSLLVNRVQSSAWSLSLPRCVLRTGTTGKLAAEDSVENVRVAFIWSVPSFLVL